MSVQYGCGRPSIESAGNSGSSKASPAVGTERLWVSRLLPLGYSFADQVFSVGATFLANVVLARTQSKEHYGMFALSYSVFTFLSALHNSIVVEPYLVYGAGRYRGRFSEYLRLMLKANAAFGAAVTALVLLVCLILRWTAPQFASPALWGLGLAVGILLSGSFLRRVFYLEKKTQYAARASLVNFLTVAAALWGGIRFHILNDFSVFMILALGWVVAGIASRGKLALGTGQSSFLESQPDYWREHWKYAKWVLATAFVFQLTTQGYYWIVAGFVSVKDVAELRVMQMLVTPIDQVFIAMSFMVVPALAARYSSKLIDSFLTFAKRYLLLTIGTTSLFVLAVRLVGKPLMHWLYAGKFDDLAPMLYIMAFLPLVMGIGNVMSNALSAAEKPKLVTYAYLCSGTTTLTIGIWLVVRFGLRGAVFGLLVSAASYTTALVAGFLVSFYRRPTHSVAG
jgi:O-antigen/teichoic acid export membrane protein